MVMGSITKRSLDVQAADTIRDAILTGQLKPGERITEIPLSEMLELSRGTIRAALRTLISEGLVIQEPYKGYAVLKLDPHSAWELYTLRNSLEGMGARLLAEQINDVSRKALMTAAEKLYSAVDKGNRARAIEMDFNLHQTIVELSRHELLKKHYGMIRQHMMLYFSLVGEFLPLELYRENHVNLVDAIAAGNVKLAGELAESHNVADGEAVVARLTQLSQQEVA